MTPKEPSHLSEQSITGKKYEYKKQCIWCDCWYDSDLSDSLKPHLYCGLKCETEDLYLEERAKYSE